ncbi:single-stranded DNA-binding protein [uncultured Thermomonospora sp.]|uniref:single-stranded DNA-binding protein n=1 Tax=uncultured Thermomonospora sp. TaxID=671175 RepID=UPI00259BC4BA|nr:single-stranded DNA-binding protein [uncultured Thermomonospora sp.]
MLGDAAITIAGNLVEDPELRYTSTGQPVARLRVASTPRYLDRQTGEWKDGETLFLTCIIWRQAAENVVESLTRGTRVIVCGRLKQRSYETTQGERRTVYEVEADEIGPSLRFVTAKVTKAARTTTGGTSAAPPADRWAGAAPAAPAPTASGTPAPAPMPPAAPAAPVPTPTPTAGA